LKRLADRWLHAQLTEAAIEAAARKPVNNGSHRITTMTNWQRNCRRRCAITRRSRPAPATRSIAICHQAQ
jgi:hypothetical protein